MIKRLIRLSTFLFFCLLAGSIAANALQFRRNGGFRRNNPPRQNPQPPQQQPAVDPGMQAAQRVTAQGGVVGTSVFAANDETGYAAFFDDALDRFEEVDTPAD